MPASVSEHGVASEAPQARFRTLLWLGVLVVNLALAALAGWIIADSRKNLDASVRQLTENYAEILDGSLAGFLQKVDMALQHTVEVVEQHRGGDGAALQSFLRREEARLPETLGLRVTDAAGVIRHGVPAASGGVPAVDISDRPHFQALRAAGPEAGLYVSNPIFSKVSHQPIIALARSYRRPDGAFGGIVYAAVPVSYFVASFARLDLGNRGNSGLWTRTTLVARYAKTDPAGAQTGATTPSPQLRALLEGDVQDAIYHARSGIDGILRDYHFRKVSGFPLYLVVGLAEDDYLAEWRRSSAILVALVALMAGATVAFGRQLSGNWRTLESARRQSELILDSAGEGICGVDAQGRVTFTNRAAREMFGWGERSGVGESLHEATHHHHADSQPYPADECPVAATLRDGCRRRVNEDLYWRRDGTAFPVEYTVSALRGPDGEIAGAVNVFRDIGERLRNERELAAYRQDLERLVAERTAALVETEARASLILDSSADGLYGIDREGVIRFVNPAACAILGYRADQLIGRPAHGTLHHSHADGEPYPASECPSYRALVQGEQVRVDNEVYWHADGHPVPVIYATHPMVRDGEIVGAVTSFVDVTEQRAAAQARERALLAAERLALTRSEFIANMSHEIRTPLNGVLGFAAIGLRHAANPDKARDAFAKIKASGERLLGVVNDILDFSKIEAGKLRIEQTDLAVAQVVRQAVDLVEERARAKGLALRVDLDGDLPERCLGDPLRLGQVLLNLLANAVKFTDAGTVSIAVRHRDGILVFRVADTGIGMNPAQVDELFTPFHQADASATRKYGGTGLGLVISKRILELMGGTIHVESTPGTGSVFEFTLPAVLPGNLPRPAPAAGPTPGGERSLAGLSVLVAEDDAVNAQLAREILAEAGARVTLAENGLEAVRRVRENAAAYDLVLMDLQMPEMDGFDAARHIGALAPQLPVVAQTAHAFAQERERCLAAGMVGHVAKPLDAAVLVDTVGRLAAPRGAAEAGGA